MKTFTCIIRQLALVVAICATAALAACLPEDKDPAANKTSGAGQLGGPSFYATSMGNIALRIQNAVVSDPDWFSSLTEGFEMTLADIGIEPDTLGVQMKSYVCPTGLGTAVQQLTWIESRDSNGKFTVKGLGTDAGTIVGALRSRLAAEQIGVFNGGSSLSMATGSTLNIPASCGSLAIPTGAPVVVFNIDRPAAPTNDIARTEYRTQSCGVDSAGHDRRGTLVQKRVTSYKADGTMVTGAWQTENMGECVDDVIVQITERNIRSGGADSDLSNFAAVALRNILAQQLQMDCMTTNVRSDSQSVKNKRIDTCSTSAKGDGVEQIDDEDVGDGSDTRIIQCAGSTTVAAMRFVNLRGNGSSNTGWTSGTATIVRVVDKREGNDGGVDAERKKWLGKQITCIGGETFNVNCSLIPGNPPLAARKSTTKWIDDGINGWVQDTNWWSNVFGCWLGGCTKVVGGYLRYLNPDYFTGTDLLQNSGTQTYRKMEAKSWIDPETFLPNTQPATPWQITSNQCLWSQRMMVVDCPFVYDSTQQGNWNPSEVSPYQALPVALDPGVGNDGSKAGGIYAQSLVTGAVGNGVTVCNSKGCYNTINTSYQQGRLTSTVALHWEKCNIKGCDRWWEYAGPRESAYIKSWRNNGNTGNKIVLSGAAVLIRESLCNDIGFKLDATTALKDAQDRYNDLLSKKQQLQTAFNLAQNTYNSAKADYDAAKVVTQNAQNAYDTAAATAATLRQDATDLRNTANMSGDQDDIDAAEAAEAAADAAEATAAQKQTTYQQKQTLELAAKDTADAAKDVRDDAQDKLDENQVLVDAAYQALLEAQQNANAGTGANLSEDQRATLTELRSNLCTTRNQTLSPTEQDITLRICREENKDPAQYQYLPSLGRYCEAVFNYNGTELSFKKVDTSNGANVQTTLLNRDGVRLAYRPEISDNKYLTVTQNGSIDLLRCARNEEKYYTWPVVKYYWDCGGKGGCKQRSYNTSTTITESTVREWQGYSYETGTWSRSQYGLRSPYGNWSSWSQVPNPITTW